MPLYQSPRKMYFLLENTCKASNLYEQLFSSLIGCFQNDLLTLYRAIARWHCTYILRIIVTTYLYRFQTIYIEQWWIQNI